MAKVEDILARFMDEIPQFIATDCVHLGSGQSVGGSVSIDPLLQPGKAAACYSEALKSNARAAEQLGVGADGMEDLLVTTRDTYVLLRPVGKEHYVSLFITRRALLSSARAVLKKYEPSLLEALTAS